ncbi:peptidoglycan DD-metalloendopeptidase family protein [Luteimonas sp. SDU101]|uniref:peptidoglycan DD-metalloendopeptidase family protein n=1 Tax=Luteimonas sp. SDU101 TaxID=3422593 RepID=UPI003EBF2680
MSRRRLAVAIAALALASAQASTLYRWTDADGRVHYADRVEARHVEGVERIAMRAEPVAVARLRVVPDAIGAQAWVDNLLAGPIEVMLHADGVAYASEPALPARATIPPYSRALLARIAQGNPRLRVAAVPGSPNARPRDVEYAWPLPSAPLRIQQAWGGSHSHRDAENRYAVDFAAPVGTPVVAARDGLVIQAEAAYGEADGEDEASLLARANFIRVLHDDGTMALYAHLQTGGVLVRPGERVRRGQSIGRSGNTGLSTAPHLHFVVQANRGMRMEAVPFRMFGPHGILRFGEARGLEPPAD